MLINCIHAYIYFERFGKTEVAIRALYRTVINGRQAAMLAPTGVLASQHYKNILQRVGPDTEFNLRIALLRGGTAANSKAGKELRQITEYLANYSIIRHDIQQNGNV